jgi:hypothetical protein
VMGSCEHGNEPSGSIKADFLTGWVAAPWSGLCSIELVWFGLGWSVGQSFHPSCCQFWSFVTWSCVILIVFSKMLQIFWNYCSILEFLLLGPWWFLAWNYSDNNSHKQPNPYTWWLLRPSSCKTVFKWRQ